MKKKVSGWGVGGGRCICCLLAMHANQNSVRKRTVHYFLTLFKQVSVSQKLYQSLMNLIIIWHSWKCEIQHFQPDMQHVFTCWGMILAVFTVVVIHFCYDSAADLPWNVSATSNRLFPSAALSPPSKNSGVSSLRVMAILLPAMCCRWMPCFHTLRASPLTTIKDRLVRGTCTSTSGSESLVKDSTESDSRFKVTSRSPQSQKSSKCGSMAAPLSDVYSRLHSSTGWKSDSCGRPCILS